MRMETNVRTRKGRRYGYPLSDPAFDNRLIDCVRDQPLLWNCRLPNYHRVTPASRRLKWENVAATLRNEGYGKLYDRATDDYCSIRWRTLRDTYIRKRSKLATSGSVVANNAERKWPFFLKLDFIWNCKELRRLYGTVETNSLSLSAAEGSSLLIETVPGSSVNSCNRDLLTTNCNKEINNGRTIMTDSFDRIDEISTVSAAISESEMCFVASERNETKIETSSAKSCYGKTVVQKLTTKFKCPRKSRNSSVTMRKVKTATTEQTFNSFPSVELRSTDELELFGMWIGNFIRTKFKLPRSQMLVQKGVTDLLFVLAQQEADLD